MFERSAGSKLRFWLGLATGLFLGSVAVLFVALAMRGGQETLQDFEALILGVIALLAAVTTVAAINSQVTQQYELEDSRRTRKELKAKSALPLAISALAKDLNTVILWYSRPTEPLRVDFSDLEASLVTLSDLIEFSTSETAKNLSALLAIYQVLRARTEADIDKYVGKSDVDTVADFMIDPNISSRMIDWAAYRSLIQSVFPYARGKTDEIPELALSGSDIFHQLHWSYVVVGTSGSEPKKISEAKARLNERESHGSAVPSFMLDLGVQEKPSESAIDGD